MNAFARADGEMMAALRADLQVFVQFLVENHRLALRTFRPKPFRNVAFFGFAAAELGLFGQRRRLVGRRRSQCRLDRFETERFLGKRSRVHELLNNIILKSARNCPDANIARAGGPKRLRARAGRRAGRENVVHQHHPLAIQTHAGAHGKRAAHVRRALLPRQQGLGRRGDDPPEQLFVQRNLQWRRSSARPDVRPG